MHDEEQNMQPSRRAEGFFWLFAVLTLFLCLGHNALHGSESRWGEIVREMIVTGDYLHPATNWEIYFDKPQLSYWFIIPFALLMGLDELTLRIPSALAALVALYATISLGKRLFDRRTALLAGWILLTSLGFLYWGRAAAADMANCAAIVWAVALFYRVEPKANFWGYLGFFMIAFVGALAKGLPAAVVPMVMVFPHLVAEKRWKKHINVASISAAFISGCVYFLPLYVAAVVPPADDFTMPARELSALELVWRENIIRVFAAFDHKDPFYSYLYNLPRIMLPWAPLLVVAIAGLVMNWKRLSSGARELMLGSLLVLVMFTCSESRRWYYVLPLAPFVALIGASSLAGFGGNDKWNRIAVTVMRYAVLVASALGVAVLISVPLWGRLLRIEPPLLLAVALPVAGVLTLVVVIADSRPDNRIELLVGLPRHLASMILGGSLMTAAMLSCALPSFTKYRTEKPFLIGLKPHLAGIEAGRLCFIGTGYNTDALFYLEPNGATVEIGRKKLRGERRLRRFVKANAGHRVALLAHTRPDEFSQVLRNVFPDGEVDPDAPDFKEVMHEFADPDKRAWQVWIVNLSEDKINIPMR